jgi:hypothetical protein
MSLEYIRQHYGVPAFRGRRVVAYGKPGEITGAHGPHVMIRLDGMKHSLPHHPTDEIEYSPAALTQTKPEQEGV